MKSEQQKWMPIWDIIEGTVYELRGATEWKYVKRQQGRVYTSKDLEKWTPGEITGNEEIKIHEKPVQLYWDYHCYLYVGPIDNGNDYSGSGGPSIPVRYARLDIKGPSINPEMWRRHEPGDFKQIPTRDTDAGLTQN